MLSMIGSCAPTNTVQTSDDVFSSYTYEGNATKVNVKNGIALVGTDSWSEFTQHGFPGGSAGHTSVMTDPLGNIYCGGHTYTGQNVAYITKYDSSGNLQWGQSLSENTGNICRISGITIDLIGNVFVTGHINSGTSGCIIFVAKYNTSGVISWKRYFGAQNSTNISGGVSIDSFGDVYITGTAYIPSAGYARAFVAKYNTSGVLQWKRGIVYTSMTSVGSGISIDQSNNIYITGRLVTVVGYSNSFVAKYNTSGVLQWNQELTVVSDSSGAFSSVNHDSSGNIYATGYSPAGSMRVSIVKFNSSGTLLWQRKFAIGSSSPNGYSVNIDAVGNVYITGSYSSDGQVYSMVLKYTSSGTLQWCRKFGADASHFTYYSAIGTSGDLIVVGGKYHNNSNHATILKLHNVDNVRAGTSKNSLGVDGSTLSEIVYYVEAADNLTNTTSLATEGDIILSESDATSLIGVVLSGQTYDSFTSKTYSSNGGSIWIKSRVNGTGHAIHYTENGIVGKSLYTNTNDANTTTPYSITSFNTDRFSLGSDASGTVNASGSYISWTFKNSPKFYTHSIVVKSTGSNTTVDLSILGVVGMVRVKRTDAAGSWFIWHRSLSVGNLLIGESTSAQSVMGHITISGTTLTLVNGIIADGTYIVEGFAHDTSPDGIIQCGSYIGAANLNVNIGFEPQFLFFKNITTAAAFGVHDTVRGFPVSGLVGERLQPSDTSATTQTNTLGPAATGFKSVGTSTTANNPSDTHIYVAIRRSTRIPTAGVQVCDTVIYSGDDATDRIITTSFSPDMIISHKRTSGDYHYLVSRLRSKTQTLKADVPYTETNLGAIINYFDVMNAIKIGYTAVRNVSGSAYACTLFKRAPKVFDEVCFNVTTSTNLRVSHNLGVVPELMIVKNRVSNVSGLHVYHSTYPTEYLVLNSSNPKTTGTQSGHNIWGTSPATHTSTDFGIDYWWFLEADGDPMVAYLFASLAGVSKVGVYLGNGTTQTIDCGFTTGARFILIKRVDSAGDWIMFDTARGITSGADPSLTINTQTAELTPHDQIDPTQIGFIVNQEPIANSINMLDGSYIFLAFS